MTGRPVDPATRASPTPLRAGARQAWDFVRNARPVRWGIDYATVLPDYLASRRSAAHAGLFDAIECYIMFVGVGRSGTTLIGSLLDAHPEMVIANQQSTLRYVRPRLLSRDQAFYLLLRNARRAADAGRVGGGGYGYAVPGQWQGRFDRIRVIGDKSRSGDAVVRLTTFPGLLDALARFVDVPIRMVHVIRNPFDTIATRARRRRLPLDHIAREYFGISHRLTTLIGRIDATGHDIARLPLRLHDFIADPRTGLQKLCLHLGVPPDSSYLDACTAIVRPEPHHSRLDVDWDPHLLTAVQRRIDSVPFLHGYHFHGP